MGNVQTSPSESKKGQKINLSKYTKQIKQTTAKIEKEKAEHTWVAIIAGGQGTRLFPLSHKSCPKQFCNVNDDDSFIQATIKRFLELGIKSTQIVVLVTNDNQYRLAKEQVLQLGVLSQNIFKTKPTLDFAGCMVKVTEFIKELDNQAIIINSPADQYIIINDDFRHTVNIAIDQAWVGFPTIVGVKINDIVTAMGCGHATYDPDQEPDFEVDQEDMAYNVTGFVEKPKEELANQLMRKGNSACNTGITVWNVRTLTETITSKEIGPKGLATDVLMQKLMKRTLTLRVAVGKFEWYDCGTLQSLYAISKKTPNHKNASLGAGEIERTDCRRSLFYAAEGLRLHVTGVEDCAALATIIDERVVITTVKLSESQRVKKLAEDYEANKDFLTDDFSVGARNNVIMRTNFSKEVRVGFVGVDNFIVYAYKHQDGTIDIAVSQQSQT